jgi:hypothetical protein
MVPKMEVITLKSIKQLQLRAILPKHKLVKVCVELDAQTFRSIKEVEGVVTQGGMKLLRV